MPDYFYHIAIEVTSDPTDEKLSAEPPRVSHLFSALRPFSRPGCRRTSRDVSFDSERGHSRHRRDPAQPQEQETELSASTHASSPADHRFDYISIDCADMASHSGAKSPTPAKAKDSMIGKGIGSALSSQYLKGHYQAIPIPESPAVGARESTWGIVHLYRDAEETPGLYKPSPLHTSDLWSDNPARKPTGSPHPPSKDEECTSLCILAVPSYMTPADFLAFVGEQTRNDVSHFRMVRTERANRYMVLMKFRNGKRAREWQFEWNGKIFNAMEPETCHVVFLKSVELIQNAPQTVGANGLALTDEKDNSGSYPRMTNDPFIPTSTGKPLPPRTPSLVELPTCPVCLERMDETTGLLTIPCQHVFHCTCLQKWSGGGCPVCRYTHDDFSSRLGSHGHKHKKKVQGPGGEYEVYDEELECETCHADTSLWQCLICGKVGCGRYEGKHAYKHFEESAHAFSMDLESKRVWDYVGDNYVHRIIQDAACTGEKLVELPGRDGHGVLDGRNEAEKDEMRVENLAVEYTHLLTSQLESQRVYFEGVLERAVDKASESTKKAEWLESEMTALKARLTQMEEENDVVVKGHVQDLEREKQRLELRARKLEDMCKDINSKYLEEKSSAKGLLDRVQYLENTKLRDLEMKIRESEEGNATKDLLMEGLREEHRDAMVQVSAERQLREMVQRGEIDQDELEGAEVSVGRKPLTARERLRERLEAEKAARMGRNLKGAVVERKDDVQGSFAVAAEKSVQEALSELVDMSALRQGDEWDAEKAKEILDGMKSKMLADGLLKPTEPVAAKEDGDEVETEAPKVQGKKKNKGKGKIRK
jgi:BRCA1-associated protein